jgi:hypothetical protein
MQRVQSFFNLLASSIIFGEHQVMAQLIAKRVLIAPLINKDFPARHSLLARGHFASMNLHHQSDIAGKFRQPPLIGP